MRPKIVIVGGGSSALMLAAELDENKFNIELYDANKVLGRKFLVAGDGGLNLTHAENPTLFLTRYTPDAFLSTAFKFFNNHDLIQWFRKNGLETFIGSSHRVFPSKGIKPIDVLQLFLKKINAKGIKIYTEHLLIDFDGHGNIEFLNKQKSVKTKADIVVFCLGGASWPVTGSKGDWLKLFQKLNVSTSPFQASNCAFQVKWPFDFIEKYHGAVFKNCLFTCHQLNHFGEAVITKFGIEGSGVYPLSPAIRQQLHTEGVATLYVDLKPQVSEDSLFEKLSNKQNANISQALRTELKLSAAQVALLKAQLSKPDFLDVQKRAEYIKHLPLIITGLGPIEDAISTVGGISLNAITETFELKNINNYFTIGEMLDYDAPTGGYLLQSCFTMANFLAQKLNSMR